MYTRDHVETYLPCVWLDSYWINPPTRKAKASIDPLRWREVEKLEGGRLERACEPDLRKATIDPSHSGSTWVELIDVKEAWRKAPLTDKEKCTLFLAFGLPPRQRWTQDEIAYNQGVSQQAIAKRLANGVDKLVARLNGGYWSELEDIEI